jgi:low temperature requirement protein LtrA
MSRFRRSEDPTAQRVSNLELFYDLVFVFAITQISHLLLDHLTWEGAGQSLLILLVVWWAWNYTTWATNDLDPESVGVRLMLIALMLANMLMAIAIPEAWGDRALLFVGSYVAIQVGRSFFLTFPAGDRGSVERARAGRILAWFVISGVLWIAGGLADGEARAALWLAALTIDYVAPLCVYWVPWGRRLDATAWSLRTEHFAERFGLFIIIALGESIVVTGATTAAVPDLDTQTIVAFAVAFLGTAALWWLYFDFTATVAQKHLELTDSSTTLARDAYTYLHAVIVAGIIVCAVGDEIVIADPGETLQGADLTAVVAGPTIYLLSLVALRLRMTGSIGGRRLAGALGCVAVGLLGGSLSALAVGALLVAVLVAVIAADLIAGHRRNRRGEPSPLERLEASAVE